MPFPTPGVPFPIPGVPFPALGVPFPTLGVPFSAPGVPFSTTGVSFPTPGVPSPMPGVPLPTPHPGPYRAHHRWGQRKTRAQTKKPAKHASQSMTTKSNHAIPRHYQRGKKNARKDLVEPLSGMSATARQGHKSKKQKEEKRNHRIADNIAHYVVANDGKGPQLALSYIWPNHIYSWKPLGETVDRCWVDDHHSGADIIHRSDWCHAIYPRTRR